MLQQTINPNATPLTKKAEKSTLPQMDFMGLLGLILGAQQQQLETKIAAAQQPVSKIVRKDMAGNVIGPQNPARPSGLAGLYAMNPHMVPGGTYAQGQKNLFRRDLLQEQQFRNQLNGSQQNGLSQILY